MFELFGSLSVGPAHAQSVTVDYRNTIGSGHPEIFGGSYFPVIDTALQQQIVNAGVTLIRGDYRMGSLVTTSTIDNYKNNVGNVQDSGTWNWTGSISGAQAARNAGLKILMIIDYNVSWNSYSGTTEGVPKDWWVFEDIVKKMYRHFPADMLEVWNEPDINPHFLDLTGSPYTSPEAAYADIYYHAAHAIRSVDVKVPIGGPTMAGGYAGYTGGWIFSLLTDRSIPNGWINFASYHNYAEGVSEDPTVLNEAQEFRPGIPVYLTEWNARPCSGNDATTVSYAGMRLSNMMNLGIAGASYYAIDDMAHQGCNFYADGKLLPKARAWRLMSKDLGLGAGPSIIKSTTVSGVTTAVAAINSSGQPVLAVVNHSGDEVSVTVILNNLGLAGSATLRVYRASYDSDDAQNPIEDVTQSVLNNVLSHAISIPPYSLAGLVLSSTSASSAPNTNSPLHPPRQ